MKHGRNELCWCGSGDKFKRCHLGREREEKAKTWEVTTEFRKDFSQKVCSAPDALHDLCSDTIVAAHTVPRSGSLNKIAENGHVLAFVFSFENLSKNNGIPHPESIGVRKASTFSGFCSTHDDELFGPIEKGVFTGSQEQCFLLAYRAYSREVYTKKAAATNSRLHKELDRGRSQEDQFAIQSFAFLHGLGLSAALRDIDHHKPRFDALFLSKNYSSVRSYIIEIEGPPPVMCSGSYAPLTDFEGKKLQDLEDIELIPHMLSVTSYFGGQKGQIVFTWMAEDDPVCIPLIESLERISIEDLSWKLICFLFETFENVHISPTWWKSVGVSVQTALIHRMFGEMGAPFGMQPFKKRDITIPHWIITNRYRIGC
jgi:hypothetical protein